MSDLRRFCETKNNWIEIRLKYAVNLGNSRTDDRSSGFEYIGLENIESGTGRLIVKKDSSPFQEQESESGGIANFFYAGDVLFSKLRPYLAKAFVAESRGIATTELLVFKPNDKLQNRFLLYVLLSSGFINLVDASTFGSKMPRADWEFIGNIFIPLPPLEEQRAIVEMLDVETARLDELIAEKERLLLLLMEKRSALITRAVTRGLDDDAPLKDSGLQWLGEIPEHWKIERLKFHLKKIEQGWSPLCYSYPAENDEWGVLKVGAVNGWEFNPNENKKLPDDIEPSEEYVIKQGDILVSRANTTELLGSVAMVQSLQQNLLLCDKLYRLTLKNESLLHKYLVFFLRSNAGRYEFERDATGASNSMQNIGQDSVRNVWILIPPLDEQYNIIDYINIETKKLDEMYEVTKSTISLLKERRAALIAAAVTGQIDIQKSQ